MQRRMQSLAKARRGTLRHVPLTLLAFRRTSSYAGGGSRIEDEDPAEVLRKLQEDLRRRAAAEAKEAPPAPPRRSGKTAFFEDSKPTNTCAGAKHTEAAESGAASAEAGLEQSGVAQPKTENAFLQKLSKMETDSRLPSFPTYNAAAEERRKKTETNIKAERSKMLVFRDVGMDLDKPILSRDVFLVLKYFRYGKEFAVDNELERMLRYFKEHATNELKIIQDSKLMRGPPSLSRKRRGAVRPKLSSASPSRLSDEPSQGQALQAQGLSFQVSSAFPQVRGAITQQFCSRDAFSPATAETLAPLLKASSAATFFATFYPHAGATDGSNGGGASGKTYNAKDDSLFTLLTPTTFRRPAVVIFSQLGQRFGSQADAEWRRLAYATVNPGLLPYMPLPDPAAEAGKGGAGEKASQPVVAGAAQKGKDGRSAHANAVHAMPIDVISLRSADVYKYQWVQRLYMRRFAKSLGKKAAAEGVAPSVEEVKNALIASTTFVGSQLLEPFYATLGLRNYLLPHVMLVDHEGVVRWLSGGLPDADEKAVFPSLLRQLEVEYLKAAK